MIKIIINKWNIKIENSIWNGLACLRNCFKKIYNKVKHQNSACRICIKVKLKKNNKSIVELLPDDGNNKFLDENNKVIIAQLDRKLHTVGLFPDVRFKIIHAANIGFNSLFRKKKNKIKINKFNIIL